MEMQQPERGQGVVNRIGRAFHGSVEMNRSRTPNVPDACSPIGGTVFPYSDEGGAKLQFMSITRSSQI